jgi:hypothetical protein
MDNVRAEARAAKERAERMLAELKASIAKHMPAELAEFLEAVAALDEACDELARKLAEVAQQNQAGASGSVMQRRDRARVLQDQAQPISKCVQAHVRAVSVCAQKIADGLDQAVLVADRARIRAALSRSRVAELRACIRSRLGPDGRGPLRWVRAEVDKMDTCLQELDADPEQATPEILEATRQRIDVLVEHARQLDYQNEERWDMARRLDHAFGEVGFTRVRGPGDPIDVGANPLRFRHEINMPDRQGATDTSFESDGNIYMEMVGAQGSLSTAVVASETCDGTIDDLVREASKLGLVIREVLWKGPDGWQCIHKQDETATVTQSTTAAQVGAQQRVPE